MLVGRKLLQGKLRDVELSIRGILRGFGLKLGEVSKGRFAARIKRAGRWPADAGAGGRPMLQAREALRAEYQAPAPGGCWPSYVSDAVCRRLMTVPGVGALVAVTFKPRGR